MNKKTKYAIYIGLSGAAIGLLGEMFPDSLKTKIQGVFPIPLSISFDFAWIMAVLTVVLLSLWFVWKYEKEDVVQSINDVKQTTVQNVVETKATSDPKTMQSTENSVVKSLILESKNNATNMNKEQILSLIDDDIYKALEELNKIFLGKNPVYKDLCDELVSQPNNFSSDKFRSRLKVFVNLNWK
jgi:cytoskeletal protein RodZ